MTTDTETDTFDADLAELRDIADRLLTAIEASGDRAFATTLLAAGNIGCGITVTL